MEWITKAYLGVVNYDVQAVPSQTPAPIKPSSANVPPDVLNLVEKLASGILWLVTFGCFIAFFLFVGAGVFSPKSRGRHFLSAIIAITAGIVLFGGGQKFIQGIVNTYI